MFSSVGTLLSSSYKVLSGMKLNALKYTVSDMYSCRISSKKVIVFKLFFALSFERVLYSLFFSVAKLHFFYYFTKFI